MFEYSTCRGGIVMEYDMSGATRYEFTGETKSGKPSHKFWIGKLVGRRVVVHFGKVDTKGQFRVTECDSEDDAQEFLEKKTAEKTKKGYKPV
jgi:predicted DNA-binding WGR domain protein